MTTLRRERIQRFTALLVDLLSDSPAVLDVTGDPDLLDSEVSKYAQMFADAAQSRAELKTDELQGIYNAADKTVGAVLHFDQLAKQAESEGKAWRGREFLTGSEYCKYGDWYHTKTGWQMYGAKSKPKQDSTFLAEFRKWWENDITIATLDKAYQIENDWRNVKSGLDQNITHPRELTAKAIAIQAAGVVKKTTVDTKEKGGFYG